MRYATLAVLILLGAVAAYADKILYVTDAGDTTVLATLSALQVKALQYELVDVDEWIGGMIQGKVNHCEDFMIGDWLAKLQADPEVSAIPAKKEDLILFITKRDDYEDRATAEAKKP